jgi:GntR family transcriptional regulator
MRSADGLPVCDERVILPYDWAPDLLTEPLEGVSMFDTIGRMLGRRPDHHTAWTINAVKATTEQGQLLEVSAGDPLIYSVAGYVDAGGRPVCIGRDYFVGGRYEIDL